MINKDWTLFLDRDGVINQKRENDYVKLWEEFQFNEKALEAISLLSDLFHRIIIVTNQRGVAKGLMTEMDLINIHDKMLSVIQEQGGRIDQIYYCTDKEDSSLYRKPNSGMALQARAHFPSIDFSKSIMIGDSPSDMVFGKKLGMTCVYIQAFEKEQSASEQEPFNFQFPSLYDCALFLMGKPT